MAAQAKLSSSFDSPLTENGGGGSLFASPKGSVLGDGQPPFGAQKEASGGQGARPAMGALLPLGLYVHVPFCSSTCDFCAFYQEKPSRQSINLYLDAVAAELAQVRREIERGEGWLWQGESYSSGSGGQRDASEQGDGSGERGAGEQKHATEQMLSGERNNTRGQTGSGGQKRASQFESDDDQEGTVGVAAGMGGSASRRTFTVFFGGGTPGLLPAKDLARLCKMVRDTLDDFGEILEWTIELAPATVRPDGVKVLLEHGVNRFSLGVQSFSDELLDGLGRQHSREQIFRAYGFLRAAGATHISCDLMFALPGQTREAWLTDLQTLADLGPEHISTYCLTFEEDTAMWVKLSQGRYKLDAEREADLYRETWAWLAKAGYAQYEVSNFARPGFRSLHNHTTWSMGRWRGVGPSAASQWGGWRFQNPANLEAWANAVLASARLGDLASKKTSLEPPAASPCSPTAPSLLSPQPPLFFPPTPPAPASERAHVASQLGNVPSTFPQGVKLPQLQLPVQVEERVELTHRLLAADALIFGLRRREGVNRGEWLARFASVANDPAEHTGAGELPLKDVEALFDRFATEGLLDRAALAANVWRLNDEGLLLADAIGSALLECFEES